MRSLHPMRRARRLGDETSTLIPSGLQPPDLSNSGGWMISSGFVGPSYNSYLQKTGINKSLGGGVWVWANADGSNQYYGDGTGAPVASTATSSPAVTASGTPVSTQTGAGLAVANVQGLQNAPGVYIWTMSDGSTHYADPQGNPVSYTPPTSTPSVTPAAGSQPTQAIVPTAANPSGVVPQFLGPPLQAPPVGTQVPAVTASGVPINTTSGAPTQTIAPAASSDIMLGTFDLSTFLTGSIISGVPNWLLLGGAAALFFFSGSGAPQRRR